MYKVLCLKRRPNSDLQFQGYLTLYQRDWSKLKAFADYKINVSEKLNLFWEKKKMLVTSELLSWRCVRRASVCRLVCPSMRACVRKLFLQKTSPQKLLTGFLRNFTGMFPMWSHFKFLQIIVFYEEFWLPWRSK